MSRKIERRFVILRRLVSSNGKHRMCSIWATPNRGFGRPRGFVRYCAVTVNCAPDRSMSLARALARVATTASGGNLAIAAYAVQWTGRGVRRDGKRPRRPSLTVAVRACLCARPRLAVSRCGLLRVRAPFLLVSPHVGRRYSVGRYRRACACKRDRLLCIREE